MIIPRLPDPHLPNINNTYNLVITGIGGTGVVTIGALLAMAAYLDGKGAGMMEMAGLAQKGGAVHIHCRISKNPEDITAIRVATSEADAIIGGDLVTTAGSRTLSLMQNGRSKAVVNGHETITGEFTRDADFSIPSDQLLLAIEAKIGNNNVKFHNFSELSKKMLGDSIYANIMILGAAWQNGMVPLTKAALNRAIELNGTNVANNIKAFELGRWVISDPEIAMKLNVDQKTTLPVSIKERIDLFCNHIELYQNKDLARKFKNTIIEIIDEDIKEICLVSYHKLLTYKDEYEVARLHSSVIKDKISSQFSEFKKITFHLAPPLISKVGQDGRPIKREFGQWILILFKMLASLKFLRNTAFDPFGYSNDRKLERSLIVKFEQDMKDFLFDLNGTNKSLIKELLTLPQNVKGFGPVKETAIKAVLRRRKELIIEIRNNSIIKVAAE